MTSSSLASAAVDALSIGGATRLFFVIGNPVAQVQAPGVINPLLVRAGIDARVVPLALPAEGLLDSCRTLLASAKVGGLLVTVPYKQAVLPLCDTLDKQARLAGAVNALRMGPDGRIAGELFDGLGFVRGMQAAGFDPAGSAVLLLGAGGAGSAIAVALAAAGVARLDIFDPGVGRSAALAASLRSHHPSCTFVAVGWPDPQDHDIVVNATPLGMRADDPLPIDPGLLEPPTLVADIVMKPADTRLLQAARWRRCPTHAGRHMLDHQLPAYLRFFGLDGAVPFALQELETAHEPATA